MKGWQKTGLELLDNVNNLSPTAKKLIKAAKGAEDRARVAAGVGAGVGVEQPQVELAM